MNTQPTADPESSERPRAAPVYVHAIGTAVPAQALTQAEAAERMQIIYSDERSRRFLRRLAAQTAIDRRYLAALDYQMPVDGAAPLYLPAVEQPRGPGMGARGARVEHAAADLITRSLAPIAAERLRDLRSLVTVTCTHVSSPGLERPVFAATALPTDVQRWNLGMMGCSAGLAGLRLVHGLGAVRGAALVVACELSSLHFQYSDAVDQITANMLFADGAAAVLLSSAPSAIAIRDCASVHLPDAADQMIWFADDNGLRLELARALPDTLGDHIGGAVDAFLARNGLTRAAVANWLVHPGGPQVLDSVEHTLGLAPEKLSDSRAVLRDYGNMSSATIFFILQRAIERRLAGPTVVLAFGPGLTIELALLELGLN